VSCLERSHGLARPFGHAGWRGAERCLLFAGRNHDRGRIHRVALLLLGGLFALGAEAGCWVSTSGMAFGPYNVIFPQPRDSTAVIQLGCLWGELESQELRVALGPSGYSGAIHVRQLGRIGGGDSLEYNLFLDPARTLVWGDDSSGGSALRVPAFAGAAPQQLLVYGRIFGGQEAMPGDYTDSLSLYILP
jgi:spore coat protein U-like protein